MMQLIQVNRGHSQSPFCDDAMIRIRFRGNHPTPTLKTLQRKKPVQDNLNGEIF